jgi:diacylglycerol kinase (ATP)
MKALVIINNAAAKARRAWPTVRSLLQQGGVDFDSYETTKPGDATGRTRTALGGGVEAIAVVGGDGTLSEAAQGFFEFGRDLSSLPRSINSNAALAILPGGTGDDFARGLTGGKRAPLEHWAGLLVAYCKFGDAKTRIVDVLYGRCDDYQTPFICLNASTMGIGGETAARVAAQGKLMRTFSGEARFALAAMIALAQWRERQTRVTIDGEVYEGMMNLAAVANALYAGGGMMLSPAAKFDDGKLDVVTASGLNRAEILRELSRIHRGGHVANTKVRIRQGTKVRIETTNSEDAMRIEADGNVRGFTPVEFQVMPRALRIVG